MTEELEPERSPCDVCGKLVTWTQAGRPRKHKCEPKEEPKPAAGGITVDRVIAAYVATRDAIAAEKKKFDAAVASMKALQEKRERWFMGEMDRTGATSMKANGVGSVFIDYKDSAKVSDREEFYAWVNADWEGRNHFLENRVAKGSVKQMLDGGSPPPPGVNYVKIKDVKVRRG